MKLSSNPKPLPGLGEPASFPTSSRATLPTALHPAHSPSAFQFPQQPSCFPPQGRCTCCASCLVFLYSSLLTALPLPEQLPPLPSVLCLTLAIWGYVMFMLDSQHLAQHKACVSVPGHLWDESMNQGAET